MGGGPEVSEGESSDESREVFKKRGESKRKEVVGFHER